MDTIFNLEDTLERAIEWAKDDEVIVGLALVGSHARGDARPDSDIDLVIVSTERERFVRDRRWISRFGIKRDRELLEDWGLVTSVRVWYECGLEIEFGFATLDWTRIPADEKTSGVIRDGIRVVYDPEKLISKLVDNAREEGSCGR